MIDIGENIAGMSECRVVFTDETFTRSPGAYNRQRVRGIHNAERIRDGKVAALRAKNEFLRAGGDNRAHLTPHSVSGARSPVIQAYWDDLKAAGADLRDLRLNHYVPGGVGQPRAGEKRWEEMSGPLDPKKVAAEREAFAEAFAAATEERNSDGTPKNDADRAESFRQRFPKTIDYVKRKINNYGK